MSMTLSSHSEYINLSFTLRCMAEKHPNDVIANSCSDLAFRMESMKKPIMLQGIDATLAQFALSYRENPENAKVFAPRGKLVNRIHSNAVDPEPVKKQPITVPYLKLVYPEPSEQPVLEQ